MVKTCLICLALFTVFLELPKSSSLLQIQPLLHARSGIHPCLLHLTPLLTDMNLQL